MKFSVGDVFVNQKRSAMYPHHYELTITEIEGDRFKYRSVDNWQIKYWSPKWQDIALLENDLSNGELVKDYSRSPPPPPSLLARCLRLVGKNVFGRA